MSRVVLLTIWYQRLHDSFGCKISRDFVPAAIRTSTSSSAETDSAFASSYSLTSMGEVSVDEELSV